VDDLVPVLCPREEHPWFVQEACAAVDGLAASGVSSASSSGAREQGLQALQARVRGLPGVLTGPGEADVGRGGELVPCAADAWVHCLGLQTLPPRRRPATADGGVAQVRSPRGLDGTGWVGVFAHVVL